jgi:hypothetical protein
MKPTHILYGYKPSRFRNLARRLAKRGWKITARCFGDAVTVTRSHIDFTTKAIANRESRTLELVID